MAKCEIYMHFGLLDEVPKKADREKILTFIRSLAQHPYTPGDYIDQDVTLRERQMKIIGNFEVTYWFDAPVNIVMVVRVGPADR
jgi:hypothetical protein